MGRGVHLGGIESTVCPGVCLAPSGAFPQPNRKRATRVVTAEGRRQCMKGEKQCIRRHENGVGTRKRAMHRNDLQGQGQGQQRNRARPWAGPYLTFKSMHSPAREGGEA
jgi:hypothetical protein